MSASSSNPSGLSELTVTCHQCGGTSMTRLDRKEYRCTHCGAITVISDDDADRLEAMLTRALNRPQASGGTTLDPRAAAVNRVGGIVALVIFASILLFGFLSSLFTHHSRRSTYSSTISNTTVPASQVVMSALQWVPDSALGGKYVGLLYNHSGYTIDVPNYTMTLFHNGMKGSTAVFDGSLRTLQPGEYEYVSFRVLEDKPDRYEIEPPTSIERSTQEIAPVKLLNPQFVRQGNSKHYNLIGVVQNTFNRPISGAGELLLYDKDQKIVGTAQDSFREIRPGEKTVVSMDAWLSKDDPTIAAYEYLIDAQFTDSR